VDSFSRTFEGSEKNLLPTIHWQKQGGRGLIEMIVYFEL
jgi:hypothetical protein